MNTLIWIEQTPFCTWVRESGSLWAYPSILFLHTIGLALVAGISAALDLRILGVGRGVPLAPLERFFPLIWFGFWINAISGTILLMADITTKLFSTVFYIKMGFIALAVVVLLRIQKKVFPPGGAQTEAPSGGKFLAAMSLFLWVGAITAGRLMAYFGPVSGLKLK